MSTSNSLHDRLFFILFFFSFFLVTCFGDDSANRSLQCSSSHDCGDGVEIKYPFWYKEASNQFCGYPEFGISCSDKKPILTTQFDDYQVKHINYENSTIVLVDIDAAGQQCPRARHNVTFTDLPLDYINDLDLNLTFYFNCTSNPFSDQIGEIPCLRYRALKSYVVMTGGDVDWYGKCVDKVVTTVMRSELQSRGLNGGFGGAMNEGFVLNWSTVRGCGACEDSGGFCGHDNGTEQFFCICSDGTVQSTCKGNRKVGLKIGIGVGAGAGGVIIASIVFLIYLRRKKKTYAPSSYISQSNTSNFSSSKSDIEKGGTYYGVHLFTYGELEEATNNFDSAKELGEGGFGTVYYGKLQDGRSVAVKRLFENNYRRAEQFMNEVDILTRLHHQNLVSLYGFTSRHSRELLLVYEYISNGTVADHLHGEKAKPGELPWCTRMKIAIETASALAYLHTKEIIHRDVKTNNILIDNNFCVKVADFGLSRLFPLHLTHVSTAPQGTPGYVDPEYHECYQLTSKSDVYSFGVVLVELISSLPAVDITRHRHEINLSNMAINKIQSGALHELVDQSLGFQSDYAIRNMITAVSELAFQCLQSVKDLRPSMKQVLETLELIRCKDYNNGKAQEAEILSDDVGLLKSALPPSPDTVMMKWTSDSSTPSISS